MIIEKKQIRYNYSTRTDSIKYIVVHDTGNKNRGADADSHYRYFGGGDRGASANIFVDSKEALEIIDCKYASWHCGDGYGKYGITNHNSIGVEICINSDGNYNQAVTNAVDVVKQLMSKYGIGIDNVVRHYDASRKSCPNTMSANNWAIWNDFKKRLTGATTPSQSSDSSYNGRFGVATDALNVRSGAGTNYGKIGELKKGEKVKIHKKVGNWFSIYYGNNGGYVSADYIKLEKINSVKDKYAIVTTDVLNVRYTPNGKIIGQVLYGTKLKMWRLEGEWMHIYSPVAGFNQAYVHKDYIKY